MNCPACESVLEDTRCAQCGAAARVRDFTVQRVLAHTPHGRLYLASDPLNRKAVLKELLPSLVAGSDEISRFWREAHTLRALAHPSVPSFLDAFTEGEGAHRRFFLAQEYIEGKSLLEWLDEGPFSLLEVEDVARDLLDVLCYLHDLTPAVVHRDIKPANLIMRPTGRLVLVDFGAARFLEGDSAERTTFIGTPGYAPPEQLSGVIDRTSDIYAVGATLIHLLSARSPRQLYNAEMELEFAEHVKAPSWVPFLSRLVARQPKRRFPTAQEALHALNAIAQEG